MLISKSGLTDKLHCCPVVKSVLPLLGGGHTAPLDSEKAKDLLATNSKLKAQCNRVEYPITPLHMTTSGCIEIAQGSSEPPPSLWHQPHSILVMRV